MIRKVLKFSVMSGLAVISLCAMSAAVGATSSVNSQKLTLGLDNPSGKTKADGTPLVRSAEHTVPTPLAPNNLTHPTPECPPTVQCEFIPAAYHNNNPADPVDYGNYDMANRPQNNMAVNSIVIHDTEGSLESTINAFQDPLFFVSAHYVINSDGKIYQMVPTKDIAWHAGNWWINMHSIGIEHVGHAVSGKVDYTPEMYKASAELVKYLSAKYGIPLDRQHIMGHDNVPALTEKRIKLMHTDPGPYWNWQNYMTLLGAPVLPTASINSKLVTVAPLWPLSKQPVTDCSSGVCVPLPAQPTNFVYLRTEAADNAPFMIDPVLGQGTTDLSSTAAKAYYGQQFAVADRKVDRFGVWYRVWYNGQSGWFRSPWNAITAVPTTGKFITPKPGVSSIPVYGRAYPEDSAYPADFTGNPHVGALPYTIAAGQRYSVVGGAVPTDYFYSQTYNSSLPYDHTNFTGQDKYIRIQYNGREAFVLQSDVVVAQ